MAIRIGRDQNYSEYFYYKRINSSYRKLGFSKERRTQRPVSGGLSLCDIDKASKENDGTGNIRGFSILAVLYLG